MQKDTEKLWQLAYKSFNRSHEAFEIPGITGGASASKEVGHRLMAHIAQLRQDGPGVSVPFEPSQTIVHAIEGDILVAEAGGWVAHDIASQMLDLLDQISNQPQPGSN